MSRERALGALKVAAVWTLVFFVGSFLTQDDDDGFWGIVSGIFWFGFLLGLLALIVLGVMSVVATRRARREPGV